MFKYGIENLTTQKAVALAKGDERGILTEQALLTVKESNAAVLAIAKGEAVVYGINTGFGPLCNTKISTEDTSQLQRNILLSHSVGTGEPVDTFIAKLMLILKVHSLSKGYSGISPVVLERILWHIDMDIIPLVPEQGSVGASGDLAPLSHLFLPLIGEGYVLSLIHI